MDRLLARRTLKRADRYIVMTEKEKNRLLALLPGAAPIHIAPLPIYHAFKPTGLPKSQVRQNLGLPDDQPVLFYFGFVRPYKGLGVLIDALKILMDQELNPHLLIVGEFWEDKSGYLVQIQALGLNNHVHIFDSYIPDDEVAAFFEAADLFVAPYIAGTQSAALKSALGFGLPVVVTDVITDAMIDSLPDRCRVVPTGDAAALAAGIVEQMKVSTQSPDQIHQMIKQSWESMLSSVGRKFS